MISDVAKIVHAFTVRIKYEIGEVLRKELEIPIKELIDVVRTANNSCTYHLTYKEIQELIDLDYNCKGAVWSNPFYNTDVPVKFFYNPHLDSLRMTITNVDFLVCGKPDFLYRDHRGGLAESMATVVPLRSDRPLWAHVGKSTPFPLNPAVHDIVIEPYGFDTRIGWDTHVVMLKSSKPNDPFVCVLGFTNGPLDDVLIGKPSIPEVTVCGGHS